MFSSCFNYLIQYPLTYNRLEEWVNNQMILLENEQQETDMIYKFIKFCGFRMYLNTIPIEGKVQVDLYFFGNPIEQFDIPYDQKEIYNLIFDRAFKEYEEWTHKRLEEEYKQQQSPEFMKETIEELCLSLQG